MASCGPLYDSPTSDADIHRSPQVADDLRGVLPFGPVFSCGFFSGLGIRVQGFVLPGFGGLGFSLIVSREREKEKEREREAYYGRLWT